MDKEERIFHLDRQSIKLFYVRSYRTLVDYSCHFTSNIKASEDIVQDIFLDFYDKVFVSGNPNKLHFQTLSRLKSYFYKAVRYSTTVY
jgi:DNA-directed RNA polymerase specialized sigma24 family protein